MALHGAVRGTIDIDLVIGLNENSFVEAEAALKAIGMQPRLPVTAREVFQFRKEYIEKRNLKAWSFINPLAPSEAVDILIIYSLAEIKVVTKQVGSLSVRIASIGDLIRMKSQSGRRQDLEDIKALEKLR